MPPKNMSSTNIPHIAHNSRSNNEWYTPPIYISAAREVMGTIDLDPASSAMANRLVCAARYYTCEDDGLKQPWYGNIWLNPPYSRGLVRLFIEKLVRERDDYEQAVVLVNNATETQWFASLVEVSSGLVFPMGRIKYYVPGKESGSPLQGQTFVYVGDRADKFLEVFGKFGWGARHV